MVYSGIYLSRELFFVNNFVNSEKLQKSCFSTKTCGFAITRMSNSAVEPFRARYSFSPAKFPRFYTQVYALRLCNLLHNQTRIRMPLKYIRENRKQEKGKFSQGKGGTKTKQEWLLTSSPKYKFVCSETWKARI